MKLREKIYQELVLSHPPRTKQSSCLMTFFKENYVLPAQLYATELGKMVVFLGQE